MTSSRPSQEYLDSFKHIYLDMDGTIAGLYNVKGWLDRIQNEEMGVYLAAKPLISEQELLSFFPDTWPYNRIWVITMAPYGCSLDYRSHVFKEKDMWLQKHFHHLNNRVFLPWQDHKNIYNSLKHNLSDILMIDDSQNLRDTFDGAAITPWWIE